MNPSNNKAAELPNPSGTPPPEKAKVIDSLWVFVMATLALGPLALPLLWRNKRWSNMTKIVGSVVIVGMTLWLVYWGNKKIASLLEMGGIP